MNTNDALITKSILKKIGNKVYCGHYVTAKNLHILSHLMKIVVWFGFFIKWHIILCGLINAKATFVEEHQRYYLTHSWKDKGIKIVLLDIG